MPIRSISKPLNYKAMVPRSKIKALAKDIAERFPTVRKVVLFGSCAYGKPTADSDVDLLIVMPHHGPGYRAAERIQSALHLNFALDLIVRSPAMISARLRERDMFIYQIMTEGVVLHESKHKRVSLPAVRGEVPEGSTQ